jgi:serpin B
VAPDLRTAAIMKMKILGALVAISFLFSCGQPPPPPGALAGSDKARLTNAAPAAELDAAVAGNTDFAFDLYRRSTAANENLFFSPHSISVALAMTYAGARNETAKAFEKTLHIGIEAPKFHGAMNDLDQQLSGRGKTATGKDGHPFQLAITNQLFAQKGMTLLRDYLDVLAQQYGANGRLMDFAGAAEKSRGQINDWVSSRTEQRIKELLPKDSVSADTRLVLVNAVYFNASWQTPFAKSATSDQAFTQQDGTVQQAATMRSSDLHVRAANVGGVELVELPYSGGELSMLVMMPPASELASFEGALSASKLKTLVEALKSEQLDLSMPRFQLRSSLPVTEALRALGLANAFSDQADFSGMTGDTSLRVDQVLHQATVTLDESGTEAAAATAVVLKREAASVTREVHLNRPFVFLIRDLKTQAVVFAGRVVKAPTSGLPN